MSRGEQQCEILVLGIGSPAGDDRLAWVAVDALRRSPIIVSAGDRVRLVALDRPGARLMQEFTAARRVILIDAVRSGAAAGTMHCVRDTGTLALQHLSSSHGFGVAEALALASAVGCLPAEWVVYGLEVGGADMESEALSPPVRRALPALISEVEQEAQRLLLIPFAGTGPTASRP